MDSIKFLEGKMNQYEKDLKLLLSAAKNIDQIKTARIKKEFEDLIAMQIIDLSKTISGFKEFIKEEKKK